MPFTPRHEHELETLDDDVLVSHMREARDAGDRPQAVLALQILVFGHWDNVRRRVLLKVPAPDVEDVTGDVIASAIRSAFDGTSVGEFVSWLSRITARRIADFHRDRAQDLRPRSIDGPDELVVADHRQNGYVETVAVIEAVFAELAPAHQRIVERFVFEDLPAREVGMLLGESEDNVYQVAKRFRVRLRDALATRDDARDG